MRVEMPETVKRNSSSGFSKEVLRISISPSLQGKREMSKLLVPQLSDLLIDKISFTCNSIVDRPIFLAHAKHVQQAFHERGHVEKGYNVQGFRYRSNYRLMNGSHPIALCQYDPVQERNSGFRMEYNPAKLAMADKRLVKEYLQALFLDNYEAVMSAAKITQIDVAVDIANIEMGELLVSERRRRKSAVWGKDFDSNGVLETVYLGAERSDPQIRIYNKAAEMRVKGAPDIGYALTRVEASLIPRVPLLMAVAGNGTSGNQTKARYQSGFCLHQVEQLENPFARINLISVRLAEELRKNYQWRLFLACCHHNGTQAALNLLPDDRRKRYIARLSKGAFNWWQPETIWKGLGDALKRLGIFPDSALDMQTGENGFDQPSAAVKPRISSVR
jgi:hypothetical protein